MLNRWRWFADGSLGCVGILKTWLVDALAATFAEGSDRLRFESLDRTRLQSAQLVRLQTEAQAGELMVAAHRAESERQLQVLLGRGEPKQRQEADTPKPTRSRVGERGLGRDPVGEQSAMQPRHDEDCSFAEVIELLSAYLFETDVMRVECPVCFASRTIQPTGEYVKYPKHKKRTTNKPNPTPRWAKNGDVWELSQ